MGEARAWARHLLAGRVGAGVLDDVLLLLSEVLTNAVVHSRSGEEESGRVTVRVVWIGEAVYIAVTDAGSPDRRPAVRAAALDDDGGRGLLLVETIAASWGSHAEAAGRSVWFSVSA
ncbi:hypothetical protein Sru01_19470 [Sphaerisporangium rufum]|uniref:Histidine kinase/HSP90-like ATPase domain-containing protein n=1 Tax=Sphaerisporangium rufum TaxID=1381558 RepID=A0A919V469_9ACTN|nr:hypothetical protein Sru01_19470 [Sphaerisporangium rufum]